MENVFNLDWYNVPFVNVCSKDRLVKGVGSVEGNQKKWRYKDYVVKLDLLGYESTAEILTSHLLRFSDIDPNRYVTYYPCIILEDGIAQGRGCYAKDFAKGYCEVTFRNILENNLMSTTSSYDDVRDVILDTTGIDFKSYIDNVLCLDAITFNDDRHFGNFSLLYNSKEWKSVIYDNGGGCLSDVMSYPLQEDYKYLCNHVLAKPFQNSLQNK